ncbi:hypothetical protein Q8A67_019983 [Cirrhinus molitorella]|uniref:Uncharacterized protein n=1 Tax=Cirrhinus molitorella TaxID=172907 RepID=A0AA88TIG6_9TELE|nr:hypothetical protein Q8A67_019983 [Cirrhinus molitorella]
MIGSEILAWKNQAVPPGDHGNTDTAAMESCIRREKHREQIPFKHRRYQEPHKLTVIASSFRPLTLMVRSAPTATDDKKTNMWITVTSDLTALCSGFELQTLNEKRKVGHGCQETQRKDSKKNRTRRSL